MITYPEVCPHRSLSILMVDIRMKPILVPGSDKDTLTTRQIDHPRIVQTTKGTQGIVDLSVVSRAIKSRVIP